MIVTKQVTTSISNDVYFFVHNGTERISYVILYLIISIGFSVEICKDSFSRKPRLYVHSY